MVLPKKSSLIFSDKGREATYESLRLDPEEKEIRELMESLWQEYNPYADSDFPVRMRNRDFQACFWEMYLGCSLIHQGVQIEPRSVRRRYAGSSDKGPDFKIVAPSRIWVEAIAPGAGTTEDAVPVARPGVVHAVPDAEVKLRYLSAIRDKAKKRLRNIQDGLVARTDPYIVAVNSGKIPHVPDLDPPRIVRAVLGLGLPEVTMDLRSGALSGWRFQAQSEISKRSSRSVGDPVSSRVFLDSEHPEQADYVGYDGVSAVLSSEMTPFNCCEPWFDRSKFLIGDDYCILHNPRAANLLPRGSLKLGREYWLDDSGALKSKAWFNEHARRVIAT
jgi:hypothetical protein